MRLNLDDNLHPHFVLEPPHGALKTICIPVWAQLRNLAVPIKGVILKTKVLSGIAALLKS
jgi:hypothetical protein